MWIVTKLLLVIQQQITLMKLSHTKNSLGLHISLTNIFKQEYLDLRLVLNLAPKFSYIFESLDTLNLTGLFFFKKKVQLSEESENSSFK